MAILGASGKVGVVKLLGGLEELELTGPEAYVGKILSGRGQNYGRAGKWVGEASWV